MENFILQKPRGYKNCLSSELGKVEVEKTTIEKMYDALTKLLAYLLS